MTGPKLPNGARTNWVHSVALTHAGDECVLAPFVAGSHGYVSFVENGRQFLIHRYVCEFAHGRPPTSAHQAAHSCGNKRCANRTHLRWATRRENEADKLIHGTRNRGVHHGMAKLTEAEVLAIRSAAGSQREIAKQFGIAQQTVGDIKTGRRWAWL